VEEGTTLVEYAMVISARYDDTIEKRLCKREREEHKVSRKKTRTRKMTGEW
jgi:hypothetical protein